MNPIKIEKGAVDELRRTIRLHDRMDELLQENDKGPSWDGDILLYSNSDLKAEHVKYRVPTQVKGKNDESLLKRNSITYPVKYKNLRNYRNDGGVCYFVIVISNDGEKAAIFYNALTPIKLEALLKKSEDKRAEQSKNITLMRLKNNDKNELYKILLQFGHDSKEQGAGELVRKAISIEDIEKIDSIRMTSFWENEQDALKHMSNGEACLYGHLTDADIWVPFAYDTQKNISLMTSNVVEKPFGVDGVVYYDNFVVQKTLDDKYIIQLSENLSLSTSENKINFTPIGDLDSVVKAAKFLQAVENGKTLYVGRDKFVDYGDMTINDELRESIEFYIKLKRAADTFGLKLNKRLEKFDTKEWDAVNKLVGLYNGVIRPKCNGSWYMWWWEDKVVPFFLASVEEGKIVAENALHMSRFIITIEGEDNENYRVPAFAMFKRDVWAKLYDVKESVLLEELEKGTFNKETEGKFSLSLLEILSAYDLTKDEKYYDLAKLMSDKLLLVSPDSDYWNVNRLQILKRKRELSEPELQELECMEQRTEDVKLICAVNILLDNKRKAKKVLGDMPKEDKEEFMNYPIYNLL